MNQNKISLAKETLQYLEKKKLRDINLKNFLSNTKLPNMNNRKRFHLRIRSGLVRLTKMEINDQGDDGSEDGNHQL